MNSVEVVGKTKEEAVEEALRQLGATIEQVTVTVDEQKSGGIFGFLAKKEVRVKVTLLEQQKVENEDITDTTDLLDQNEEIRSFDEEEATSGSASREELEEGLARATSFLKDVFASIGISDVVFSSDLSEEDIKINITGDEASRLIGRRGDSLDSLQMLTNLAANKGSNAYQRVLLDIEGYRAKRSESLQKYALKMAKQAAKQRRIVRLEPMNPYERRIVHSALQDDRYVKTYSEGKDPYRKVVIEPKYRR